MLLLLVVLAYIILECRLRWRGRDVHGDGDESRAIVDTLDLLEASSEFTNICDRADCVKDHCSAAFPYFQRACYALGWL